MSYYILPSGPTVSHVSPLQALSTSGPIAGGNAIVWRLNGSAVKSGSTSDPSALSINTGAAGDYAFAPKDAGLQVDFYIGAGFAPPITLSNQLPSIPSAIVEMDISGLSPKSPMFYWTFEDPDGDPQYFYHLIVGSGPGGTNFYDSGTIFGNPGDANGDGVVDQADYDLVAGLLGKVYGDPGYVLAADFNRDGIIDQKDLDVVTAWMGKEYPTDSYSLRISEMVKGLPFFWRLTVGDGEKVNPTDPDWPEPARKYAQVSGEGKVNWPPDIGEVKVDGV